MNIFKKISLLFIFIPTIACASNVPNNPVPENNDKKLTQVNIISVTDMGYHSSNVSQSYILYTANGSAYYTPQLGKPCNFTFGIANVKYDNNDLIIEPNSSCDTIVKTNKVTKSKLEIW